MLDPLRMLDEQVRRRIIEDSLAELTTKFSVWRRDQVTAAIDARLPVDTLDIPAAAQPALLDALTAEALGGVGSIKLSGEPLVEGPANWRRAEDGRGFHEPPVRYDRFSSAEILTQEDRLVEIAQQHGAITADPLVVEAEIIVSTLRPDQRAVVRTVLTLGQRIDTLIGPAGAGKSYTLAELARIWETTISAEQGEARPPVKGRVIGLAPSEGATRVLAENGITHAVNLDRFINAHKVARAGWRVAEDLRGLVDLRPTDLVIVDELAPTGE